MPIFELESHIDVGEAPVKIRNKTSYLTWKVFMSFKNII